MRTYTVNVIPKRPAFNDRGYDYEITAKNKAEAISEARRRMGRDMHYDRLDGALIYTATEGDQR
jgi:hypothetical protein